jgi:hypothetical protein
MKTIKTLVVLALAFSVITLNSCKKNSVKPAATISASIDGTTTSFNTSAKAIKTTVQGISVTTIQGTASNGTNLSIVLSGAVTAGQTYSASASSPSNEPLIALTSSTDQFWNDDSSSNLVSVTISSVSSSSIQGTFKGNLVSTTSGSNTPPTKVIANGTFNVSF